MPFNFQILYEDSSLLVINKPSGVPTLPDGYDPDAPFVRGLLEAQVGPLLVVHRLDRETSGVLLFARTAEAHRDLNTQFELHSVQKTYHALVIGSPEWQEKTLEAPLRANGDRKHRTVIDSKTGKPAVTHFRVLERFGPYTLIEAQPETGRTHQIRAHLAFLGLHIAGDPLYGAPAGPFLSQLKKGYRTSRPNKEGEKEERPMIDRVALHAISLEVNHPTSGERMKLEAPYPKDMEKMIMILRKNAA